VRPDPPRIVWSGILWRDVRPAADLQREETPAMPTLSKPADLETIAYAEGDRVCIDVVLGHVVVQTVMLSLAQLREYRRMIAAEAARRPAVGSTTPRSRRR
jgi:hypothetical protein